MADKICPLMSYRHPVTETNYAYDRTRVWKPKTCRKFKCAWWLVDKNICAIVAMAMEK